jgi:integrase
MARRRTGTVEAHGDHFDVRVTLPDGQRSKRACLPPGLTRREAQAEAARLTELAWKHEAKLAAPVEEDDDRETVEYWADRWFTMRAKRGLEHQDAERSRWTKWIDSAPVRGRKFGDLPIAGVTREDLEDLVTFFDGQVQAEAVGWKTLANAWGLVSKAFSDACRAKDRSIRVRTDNPCKDVPGPDRGSRKAKAWLHPREVLAVLSSDAPLAVRRAVALNVYLYPRPGELRALSWDDVDLVGARVTFHRALRRDGSEKGTKTGNVRTVPIEPTLLPLLGALREAAGGVGRVVDLPHDTALADVLRDALRAAGVQRAELFGSTKTRKQITWYDLRASGVTWRAIRGDNPIAIMHQAGHSDFKTTQLYIREAQAIGADFGEVFPRLPTELYETVSSASIQLPNELPEASQLLETVVGRQGLETEEKAAETAGFEGIRPDDSHDDRAPTTDVNATTAPAGGTLDEAIAAAARAGRWDVVVLLGRELEARRFAASPNVVAFDPKRRTR